MIMKSFNISKEDLLPWWTTAGICLGNVVDYLQGHVLGTGLVLAGAYGLWYMYRPRNLPPGPWGYPLVGSLFSLGPEPHVTLMELQRKYGDVVTLWMGGSRYHVYVNSYEAAKELLITNGGSFAHRDVDGLTAYFGSKDYLFTPNHTEKHKLARKQAMTSLKNSDNGQWDVTLGAMYDEIVGKLSVDTGKHVEIERIITENLWKHAYQLLFGRWQPVDPGDLDVGPNTISLVYGVGEAEFLTWLPYPLQYFLRPILRQVRWGVTKPILAVVRKEVEWHLATYNSGRCRDICDMYIKDGLDKESVVTSLYGLMPDSFATVADGLTAVLIYVARHPEYQDKMYREIVNLLQQKTPPSGRHLLLEDKAELPLTAAFLEEVLRVAPVFPRGFGQRSTETRMFRGYTIPAYTQIFPNFYAINRDPSKFQDPEEFFPERHLQSGRDKSVSMAFSIGRRSCVGERLSRATLFFFLANLVKDFRFTPRGKLSADVPVMWVEREPLEVFISRKS